MDTKNGKLVMKMKGYCDEKNPERVVNREIEVDMNSIEKSFDKLEHSR